MKRLHKEANEEIRKQMPKKQPHVLLQQAWSSEMMTSKEKVKVRRLQYASVDCPAVVATRYAYNLQHQEVKVGSKKSLSNTAIKGRQDEEALAVLDEDARRWLLSLSFSKDPELDGKAEEGLGYDEEKMEES